MRPRAARSAAATRARLRFGWPGTSMPPAAAGPLRSHAGCEWLVGVAGRDRDVTVRRDANRELGIDQVEAFGAQPPHQQRHAGKPDLGLRRRGHDGTVVVADDDIADTNGDADPPCPFDLRAADLDGVAVTDILLDRRSKPRRRHVEIDRAGAQPPPQAEETAGKDHRQRRDDDREPPDPAFAGDPPLQRREACRRPGGCRDLGLDNSRRARWPAASSCSLPRVIVPLPGGAGCVCWRLGRRIPRHGFPLPPLTDGRRSGRARRQGEAAPVRASVPIPD